MILHSVIVSCPFLLNYIESNIFRFEVVWSKIDPWGYMLRRSYISVCFFDLNRIEHRIESPWNESNTVSDHFQIY